MTLDVVSEHRCFGGVQGIYRHQSSCTKTEMRFSVFVPSIASKQACSVLWFLSGLTCTEENFTVKAGAQQHAERCGIVLAIPDTSPRGAGIEGEDESYDFGTGAGFYLDATQPPWNANYRMYSYITQELQNLVVENFPVDRDRQSITGHSMGGHGALTIGLKNPELFRSISAFSPICAPSQCPWGRNAFTGYLGESEDKWSDYDAVALIEGGHRSGKILVDQGQDDGFLEEQLKPDLLSGACEQANQSLELRMHPGYDHSYFFISSFISDHIEFHSQRTT